MGDVEASSAVALPPHGDALTCATLFWVSSTCRATARGAADSVVQMRCRHGNIEQVPVRTTSSVGRCVPGKGAG